MRNGWLRKQYIIVGATCAYFLSSQAILSQISFWWSKFDDSSTCGIFLKKTKMRSPSSDVSKIPDEEFPVRSSASDAQMIGVQRL